MLMTPRQMLAFGELYLNGGRANGRQVVPERWVERSCQGRERRFRPGDFRLSPGAPPDPMRDRRYGYGWWVRDFGDREVCFAWGYGGQYIFVVPDLDLVVVTTSSTTVSDERRGHRRVLFDIVERLVMEPVTSRASGGASQKPAVD
jgi:CubicO group peptidase (beta-lactamase class C family)